MGRPSLDITNHKFGKLTAIRHHGYKTQSGQKREVWWCRCECGVERPILKSSLQLMQSCGCLRKSKGGISKTKEYRAWQVMHYYNKGNICERWSVFDNFLSDMGRCDGECLTRNDVSKPWEPGNVIWGTRIKSMLAHRGKRKLTYKGETLFVTEWARRTGIHKEVIYGRIRLGWTVEEALTTQTASALRLARWKEWRQKHGKE